MKKITTILAILMLTIQFGWAQKPDTAKLIVHYKFSHLRDTTQKDKPYTENMVLFLGQSASAYKSYDRKLQQEMMQKQVAQQMAEQKGSGRLNINVQSRGQTTSTEYYQFPVEGKFIRKERLITPYLIEEPMPVINWKISADTMTVGSLHCQKATGHFKGRDYTARFTTEVPFHAGPWKLSGLPGLIVEAYDTNKEVVFKFDNMEEAVPFVKATEATPAPGAPKLVMFGMEEGNTDPNIIAVPTNAVKTTEKEFKNLQEAMRKDPNAFAQAAMAGSGGSFRAAPDGGSSNMRIRVNGKGPVINNPLELPEKNNEKPR
ncbi:GLPGLI family protein [Mucilaginibacter sp. S1162]|uniref:GLPGLI family protein n=1 Tax=Mucilaginibacter humi TaxID=2732510 RepID=A0ABX1W6P8_9SPHI|nr:GLPGLI family protein [Mucilaginibacter humi]NNU34351.1 GLPGLI family protein [Mucilaginibacter humi]